jgi:Family of unknown function (DUF5677)
VETAASLKMAKLKRERSRRGKTAADGFMTNRLVSGYARRLEKYIVDLKMVPATHRYRSRILLGLMSRALWVARSICCLERNGFYSEAFAQSRTLMEIFFTVRYLTNKETEERMERYVDYFGRVHVEWEKIFEKYYPEDRHRPNPFHDKAAKLAKKYKTKHKWVDSEYGQVALMALEEHSVWTGIDGKPLVDDFEYNTLYFAASQYVHSTIDSLKAHMTMRGKVYRPHPHPEKEEPLAQISLFTTLIMLCRIFRAACDCMNEERPAVLAQLERALVRYVKKNGDPVRLRKYKLSGKGNLVG